MLAGVGEAPTINRACGLTTSEAGQSVTCSRCMRVRGMKVVARASFARVQHVYVHRMFIVAVNSSQQVRWPTGVAGRGGVHHGGALAFKHLCKARCGCRSKPDVRPSYPPLIGQKSQFLCLLHAAMSVTGMQGPLSGRNPPSHSRRQACQHLPAGAAQPGSLLLQRPPQSTKCNS